MGGLEGVTVCVGRRPPYTQVRFASRCERGRDGETQQGEATNA